MSGTGIVLAYLTPLRRLALGIHRLFCSIHHVKEAACCESDAFLFGTSSGGARMKTNTVLQDIPYSYRLRLPLTQLYNYTCITLISPRAVPHAVYLDSYYMYRIPEMGVGPLLLMGWITQTDTVAVGRPAVRKLPQKLPSRVLWMVASPYEFFRKDVF